MARKKNGSTAPKGASRYIVNHAFAFHGALDEGDTDTTEHWITAGSAHKVAQLPKEIIDAKIASGAITDSDAAPTSTAEASE